MKPGYDQRSSVFHAVFLTLLLVLAAAGICQTIEVANPSFESGEDTPDGWQLSGGAGGWLEDAAVGNRAVFVEGKANSEASTYWYGAPVAFEPNTVYRLSFQARRASGSGGSPISGPEFCNRDLHEVTGAWQTYTSYFVAPANPVESRLRFGQWNAEGVVGFDDISLVRALPVYERRAGIALGAGERITGDQYTFSAPLASESANHARVLKEHDCFFNQPRWVFSADSEVTYFHQLGEAASEILHQVDAEIKVTVGYYRGGALSVEAKTSEGADWIPVGTLDNEGVLQTALPPEMFPAKAVLVRLRGIQGQEQHGPVAVQVHEYDYRATLEKAPGDLSGNTRFVAVPKTDARVAVELDRLGDAVPGGNNILSFRVSNLTGQALVMEPRVRVMMDDRTEHSAVSGPVEIPPALPSGEESAASVLAGVSYEVPGAGAAMLRLDLGDGFSYLAEANFAVSCLYETEYGHALPDTTEDVALWWASSGWKVSRPRPVPRMAAPAMRIQLAANETEAAQFVLRPSRTLQNLSVHTKPLHNTDGTLSADSIEVLRVGYVPVTLPTDSVGAVGDWPDPLPPLTGSIDLAANENQPFWVRIHASADTEPGIYTGAILLEADGWQAEVPLEVEIFDFSLPDRKTCVTAFGFDAPLAFDYHQAGTEVERRAVYEAYLALLSAHHISIYNPAFLDPIRYDWPHLPKWQGGERVSLPTPSGDTTLRLHDDSETSPVSALYDELLPVPKEGLNITVNYKTGTPGHVFLVTLLHYDVSGVWMPGQNNDIAIEGDGTWQRFDTTVGDFPEGATHFKLRLWATHYTEAGEYTGTVWFDDLVLLDTGTDVALVQEDFAPMDLEQAEDLFVPEFDWTNWDDAMTRAFEQYHFNSFVLPVPGLGGGTFHARHEPSLLGYGEASAEYQAAFTAWCRLAEAHLREKGWLDKAFIYWFDEPAPDDYAFVMNGFRKLKEAAPGLNRMLTEKIVPELVGGPNIWCPVSPNYNRELAEQRQAAGERIWWYVCTWPKAPYATLFIDHPATEMRVWLWQTWERRIDGILIWQTNYWTSREAYPETPQNPYEDPMSWTTGYGTPVGAKRPWGNGDGRFMYPPLSAAGGRPAGVVSDAPVGSIRLDMLRDGIEDYEYLVILRDLLEEHGEKLSESDAAAYRNLLEVPPEITASLTEFTLDPAPMEKRRESLARAIVTLKRMQ